MITVVPIFFFQNDAIVKIQAWTRANVAQNDYRKLSEYYSLMNSPERQMIWKVGGFKYLSGYIIFTILWDSVIE